MLTIKQVAEIGVLINELTSRDSAEPFLPFKTKLKLATITRKLKGDLEHFNETRNSLIKEFGEEQEDGNISIKDTSPKYAGFLAKFDVLLASESTTEAIKTIPADELGENKLSTAFIMQLQDAGLISTQDE